MARDPSGGSIGCNSVTRDQQQREWPSIAIETGESGQMSQPLSLFGSRRLISLVVRYRYRGRGCRCVASGVRRRIGDLVNTPRFILSAPLGAHGKCAYVGTGRRSGNIQLWVTLVVAGDRDQLNGRMGILIVGGGNVSRDLNHLMVRWPQRVRG